MSDYTLHISRALEVIAQETPTLRDQFAMAALTGLLTHEEGYKNGGTDFAPAAYRLADAMMREREKKNE